jgi:Protein of unknown function (DUF3738)
LGPLQFPCDVELLDDFFDGGSGFEVFEHGGHRHPGIAKYPCAIQCARHAFNCGALGPIESCHTVKLEWTPDTEDDGDGKGSIFTALKEQLGLQLESRKGQVPVFVIKKIEKQSPN